ncbi:MAG: formylglycine-generating enzyme family protein [Phycisphaerales bacterium]|nr:formylglycine-generating enzyme family protein [Phycisphaerales bacterium]
MTLRILAQLLVLCLSDSSRGDAQFSGIDPIDVVRHVVSEQCASCHSGQGPGPFSLLTDVDLARHGPTMVRAVETKLMPPWLPAAGSSGWRDACQLAPEVLAAFHAWKEGGFVITPATQLPAHEFTANKLPLPIAPALTVDVAFGWTPNAQDPDALRSFSVPLKNETTLRIRGWIATRESPTLPVRYNLLVSTSPVAMALDEADPGIGFGRLGDLPERTSGSAGAIGVDGRFELPAGFAIEIPPQATLVAEAIASGKGRSLSAGATLRTIPARVDDRIVHDFCVIPDRSAPAIRADTRVHVTTEPLDAPLDLVAIILRPDMRARALALRRVDVAGNESTLLEIPKYIAMLDRGYVLAAPLRLARGDRIRYEITYDTANTARRATPVAVLLTAQPLEHTADERAAPPPTLSGSADGRACETLAIDLIALDSDEPFRMSRTEITQRQFQNLLKRNPSLFATGENPLERPVDSATWFDAAEFCNTLSTREGLPTRYELTAIERTATGAITSALVRVTSARSYRLPSEAQWLQCACAAAARPLQTPPDDADVKSIAWLSPWAQNISHPVATKAANALGFHDLSGNVWEWCEDAWDDHTAQGPVQRAIRGGAWCDTPAAAACDFRSGIPAGTANSPFGFRIALDGLRAKLP